MPLPRAKLLELTVRLGHEFKRRRMFQHAAKLRAFYLLLRRGMASRENSVDVQWSEALVLDWLRTLRIRPFERDLRVRPRNSRCPRCPPASDGRAAPQAMTDLTFPGGARMRCARCGLNWLEPDAN